MDTFPLEDDPIPEGYKGWLILFDEFPSAPMSVQAAAYKIVLDKMVGQHKLHPKVAMMAAGNLLTDRAIVNRISTALQSRMIHFELIVNAKDWFYWAQQNDIDHRIVSFLQFTPDLLHKFDPDHTDHTFACPRTWHFQSDIIKPWKEITFKKLPVMAGTITEGIAREFVGYCEIFESLPTIKDILSGPKTFSIPDNEPSIMHAISGLISSYAQVDNMDVLIHAIERLPVEFQIISLKGCVRKNTTFQALKEHSSIKKWVTQNAQELL